MPETFLVVSDGEDQVFINLKPFARDDVEKVLNVVEGRKQ